MNTQNKYIPINSANLGTYFSRALIVPRVFIKDSVQDLQSANSEMIIFSKDKFTENSDCCIEVLMIQDEYDQAKQIENSPFSYYRGAIPISRIVAVYFYSKELMDRTVGLTASAAYLPDRLTKSAKRGKMPDYDRGKLAELTQKSTTALQGSISKYDRYLGGFAFMKHGGLNYTTYSPNYFSTLSIFCRSIDSDLKIARRVTTIEDKYNSYFDSANDQMGEFRAKIENGGELIDSFIRDKVPIKNNKYVQDEAKGNKRLYLYSILANYGPDNSKPMSTESLLKAMHSEMISHREAVSLYFGNHVGYKSLRKIYTVDDKIFPIKNELASKLDYYTIESIYQYVFNGDNSGAHSYLNQLIPINEKKIDTKGYKTFSIYDEDVIYAIKPKNVRELLHNFLNTSRFQKVLSVLSERFQKKNNLDLTENQKNIYEKNYFDLLNPALKESLSNLEIEVNEYIDEINNKFKDDLGRRDKELSQLNERLSLRDQEFKKMKDLLSRRSQADPLTPTIQPRPDIETLAEPTVKVQMNIHEYYLKNAPLQFLRKLAVQRHIPAVDKLEKAELIEALIKYFRDDLSNPL